MQGLCARGPSLPFMERVLSLQTASILTIDLRALSVPWCLNLDFCSFTLGDKNPADVGMWGDENPWSLGGVLQLLMFSHEGQHRALTYAEAIAPEWNLVVIRPREIMKFRLKCKAQCSYR